MSELERKAAAFDWIAPQRSTSVYTHNNEYHFTLCEDEEEQQDELEEALGEKPIYAAAVDSFLDAIEDAQRVEAELCIAAKGGLN